MKKFLFLFFFLGFFPLSAQASTFFEQTGENGYVEPILPGRSFTWNSQGEIIGRSTLAAFDPGYYPATTTAVRYIKSVKFKLRKGALDNWPVDLVINCEIPNEIGTGGVVNAVSTNSYTANDLTDTFEIYTFHMPPNFCDLSKYTLGRHAFMLGFVYPPLGLHIAGTTVPTVPHFGIGVGGYEEERSNDHQVWIQVEDGPPVPEGLTPVLIVPGIMGSELYKGDDLIWPDLVRDVFNADDLILVEDLDLDNDGNSIYNITKGQPIKKIGVEPLSVNIFDNLNDFLQINEYIENENFFYFPYDWRLDLNQTKELLRQKIIEIKIQTGFDKVNIIAHSMGGLVVKSYLSTHGNASVDKLVFVGTPHLGAPKAGKVLLEGDGFGIPWVINSQVRDLALNSPSVYELLPDEQYFQNYQGYVAKYRLFGIPPFLNSSQTKDFFIQDLGKNDALWQNAENFKSSINNLDFTGMDVYNISGCKTPTQTGYQLSFNNKHFANIGYSSGDETVPLVSGDAINVIGSNRFYVKNADHSELPSMDGVRQTILGILKNQVPNNLDNVKHDSGFCKFKGKSLTWRSPVEVHIYSNGNHTGPIENNAIEYGIPGVDYVISGGEKFVFLPTDEGQIYQISGIGEDQGTFDLLVSENDNGSIVRTKIYNDIPLTTGTPVSFEITETSQDAEILVNNQIVVPNSSLVGDLVLDISPPVTEVLVTGALGTNGWYKTHVQLSLTSADDLSGVMVTKYRLNGGIFADYTTPIFVNTEGVSSLEYYSVDNAGNNEQEHTINFTIDKASPEFTVIFNISTKDFEFGTVDNIDSNPGILCTFTQCTATDLAGNTSVLKFEKKSPLTNTKNLLFKSISYNGQVTNFDSNALNVIYTLSGGNITDISQTEFIKNQKLANLLYSKKTNLSTYTDWSKGIKPTITKYPGLKYLQLETNNSQIQIKLK